MLISCLSWYSFVPFLSSESLYTSLSLSLSIHFAHAKESVYFFLLDNASTRFSYEGRSLETDEWMGRLCA